jgi:hypothetical protein
MFQKSEDDYGNYEESKLNTEAMKRVNEYLRKKRIHDENRQTAAGGEEKKEDSGLNPMNVSFADGMIFNEDETSIETA